MYGKNTTAFLSLFAAYFGRRISYSILFILLANFLATSVHATTPSNIDDTFQTSEQTFVICTPQGLKRITLDKNGNPVSDEKNSLEHCLYCLPFQKIVINDAFLGDSFPNGDLFNYSHYYGYDDSMVPCPTLNASCAPRAPPLA